MYYTREFRRILFGYGSTYPDIQDRGDLFEQASSRPPAETTGPLTFAFTIKNQFRASISSFEAAKQMRPEFNKLMHDFYKEASTLATADMEKAYIFGAADDAARSYHLADIIRRHQIEVYQLNEDITVNGVYFKKGKSYIVPTEQAQYRLIKAMFEVRNSSGQPVLRRLCLDTADVLQPRPCRPQQQVYNLANVSPIGTNFAMKKVRSWEMVKHMPTDLGGMSTMPQGRQ